MPTPATAASTPATTDEADRPADGIPFRPLHSPSARRGKLTAVAVVLGLMWTQVTGHIVAELLPSGVAGLTYSRSLLASLADILVLAALLVIAAGVGPGRLLRTAGVAAPVLRPLLIHLAIFVPTGLLCALVATFAEGLELSDLLWLGFGGPLSEEIVFRGLAVGGLMLLAGWRFLPAVILPALVFGIAHAAQGSSAIDTLAIVAITLIGGLVFGWLFVRWRFNLWPAIFAHVGLNALWTIFALGDTAIGGWFGNVLRLVLIGMLVAVAWRCAPASDAKASRARTPSP